MAVSCDLSAIDSPGKKGEEKGENKGDRGDYFFSKFLSFSLFQSKSMSIRETRPILSGIATVKKILFYKSRFIQVFEDGKF